MIATDFGFFGGQNRKEVAVKYMGSDLNSRRVEMNKAIARRVLTNNVDWRAVIYGDAVVHLIKNTKRRGSA